jgi:hypothetical protein
VAANKVMVDKFSIPRNEFYCLTINDVERKNEAAFQKIGSGRRVLLTEKNNV